MTYRHIFVWIAAVLGLSIPATAQVSGFSFVNNAGGALTGLSIRRVAATTGPS